MGKSKTLKKQQNYLRALYGEIKILTGHMDWIKSNIQGNCKLKSAVLNVQSGVVSRLEAYIPSCADNLANFYQPNQIEEVRLIILNRFISLNTICQ